MIQINLIILLMNFKLSQVKSLIKASRIFDQKEDFSNKRFDALHRKSNNKC